MQTVIACVLKSGGGYGPGHVARLARQCGEHMPSRSSFLCLTDVPEAVEQACPGAWIQRLQHDWPGWWSKLDLLSLHGPALYLDLDVSIVGGLAPLLEAAERHDLVMIRSLWGPDDPNLWNSSVMAWRADAPRCLHELFKLDPHGYIAKHSKLPHHRTTWGDQGFIASHYPDRIEAWDDLLPGAVMSYKRGALLGRDTSGCRILVSHGKPKPWEHGGADQWLKERRR